MLAVYEALRSFLPDLSGHHILLREDNMSVVFVFEPSERSEVTPSMQPGAPDPPVVQRETVISQRNICPQGPESGGQTSCRGKG